VTATLVDLNSPEGAAWTFVVVLIVVILGPLLAERARLAGIIGLLIGGVVIGEHGLDLIEDPKELEDLGQVGLLYLMFLAGLELDLKVFEAHRRGAVGFGAASFAIPLAIGIGAAFLLDYGTAAAVLIGVLWASHTLLTYPEVRRRGIARHPAVATAVGGTVVTDTAALLLLAVVAGLETGSGSGASLVGGLAISIAVVLAYCFVFLPWLTRRFFRGVGQERTLRFVFIFAAGLSAAVLADVFDLEGIVGAFFAGLALNRLVPNRSPLMDRVEFFGAAFLIPLFLISVGLLIDPSVLADPDTLGLAAVFLGVVLIGKASAALLVGRLQGFNRPAIGVMFGLSAGQAAATLATATVGIEIGLFDAEVLNAALIVILFSVVIASLVTVRSADALGPAVEAVEQLGACVLVPVEHGRTSRAPIRLAARIAEADGGVVAPLHVATSSTDLAAARHVLEAVDQEARAAGISTDSILRLDDSVSEGVLNAVAEQGATLIVADRGHRRVAGELLLGRRRQAALESSAVPVVLAALADDPESGGELRRALLAIEDRDLRPSSLPEVAVALHLAKALSVSGLEVRVAVADRDRLEARGLALPKGLKVEELHGGRSGWLDGNASPGDLLLLPARPGSVVFGREARRIVNKPGASVAAIASPHGSGRQTPGEELGSQVVVGRAER
jgi:Kef-type K+ transport system membrane component KefB